MKIITNEFHINCFIVRRIRPQFALMSKWDIAIFETDITARFHDDAGASRLACLATGTMSCAASRCLFLLPCGCLFPCLSVRWRLDEMRLMERRYQVSAVTCLPCRLAPLIDMGDGEGSWCRRCLFLSDFCCLPLSLACGSDGSGLLACSYGRRSFPSCDVRVRGFCGSRSLRLPWLLRHGILSLCREGG